MDRGGKIFFLCFRRFSLSGEWQNQCCGCEHNEYAQRNNSILCSGQGMLGIKSFDEWWVGNVMLAHTRVAPQLCGAIVDTYVVDKMCRLVGFGKGA